MSKKKVNPRRRPISESDYRRRCKEYQNDSITWLSVMYISGMKDCGIDDDTISAVVQKVNYMAAATVSGDIDLNMMRESLKDEYDIDFQLD